MDSTRVLITYKFGSRMWRRVGLNCLATPNKVGKTVHVEIQKFLKIC